MSFIDWLNNLFHPHRRPPAPPPPPPKPPPTPKPPAPPPFVRPKRCLYFITSSWLLKAKQPAKYWQDLGFTGLITMVDDTEATALFNPAFNPIILHDQVSRVRDAAGDMELWLSHWSQNNWPPFGPNKQLLDWNDDAAWERFYTNLEYLSGSALSVKAAGILMDAEYYPVTGTFQDPKIAWTGHARVPERATGYARALRSSGPFTLGNYVTYTVENPLAGFGPWWRAVEQAAPGTRMFAEDGFLRLGQPEADYAVNRTRIKAGLGCESLGGVGINAKLLANNIPQARFPLAVKGSPDGVWVFPWIADFLSDPAAPQVAQVRKILTGV
jgi:hypothetical protein